MNRIAIQDYLSIKNFCEIVTDTHKDIEKHGIEYLISDHLSFDGILHRIELLGEISKNLSENFKQQIPEIKWSDIARTRDLISHHYHDIDPEIIKSILEEQIFILLKILPKLSSISFNCLDPEDQREIV